MVFSRLFAAVFLLFLASCESSNSLSIISFSNEKRQKPTHFEPKKAKNIIFIIGDGTALAQITAMVYDGGNRSALEQFPVVGFHKNWATNDLVTDSAAGATAFSCGCKTYNSAIGMNKDTVPCQTMMEKMKLEGWATGMAANCSAVHATPAGFIAHQRLRTFYYEIAEDYLKTDFDCLVAGGEHYFTSRDDGRNLRKELEKKGYETSFSPSPKKAKWDDPTRPIVVFTDEYEPESALNGRRYLPDAVKNCSKFLKNRSKKGFFLMAEGSQVDWATHANDGRWMLAELRDLEKTIAAALEVAKSDGETLLVVTGDHDGAGMSIEKGSTMRSLQFKFASKDHGGVMVPIFAFGPGSDAFSGIYENTEIRDKMLKAVGLK